MSISVNGMAQIPKLNDTLAVKNTEATKTSFSDVINDAITKVNDLQIESSKKTEDFISSVSDDIHSVVMAGSKADLALQMTLQVRNKVMEAYKEIMNMQM